MSDPQPNIFDEKIDCLVRVLAAETGTILRCIVDQQIAAKQAEIEQRILELRGLQLLISGNTCQPDPVDNPVADTSVSAPITSLQGLPS